MCAFASTLMCAVKFVNSFARRQNLFDIAAEQRLTAIQIFCRILLFCSCYTFTRNVTT